MATKLGTAKNDRIPGTEQNDTIDGKGGNDTLLGAGGNDSIIGGAGLDVLDGGSGNDTLLGGTGADSLVGGSGNDRLSGGEGNDTLDGGSGKDTLDGGIGNDSMMGGPGNDLYVVNSIGDKVIETDRLNSIDTVQSTVSFVLPDLVEHLQLQGIGKINGTGNKLNNQIIGNAADNLLSGGDGQDTLIGGAGADTLEGGKGIDSLVGGADDDTYVVSSTEDKIVETANGGEADEIQSSVDYTLPENVEVLTLTGTANLRGAGNEEDNILNGNDGANDLSGDAGDDILIGNAGNDTLSGDAGNDQLDGGEGDDTAIYAGNIAGYQITFDSEGNSWLIEDIDDSDGDDGSDTLIDIEHAVFADEIKDLSSVTPTLPSLAIGDVRQAEGTGAKTTPFVFTVDLSALSDTAVTVDYTVLAGTALAGSDFTATSGTLSIGAGESSGQIVVNVKADGEVEPDETFTVQLSNPQGAELAQAVATGTILNDDQPQALPVISIADAQVQEGNDATAVAVLTVTLSAKSTEAVEVDWSTADGSALAGSDYTAMTGTLSIPAGRTSGKITIPIIGDTEVEPDETFTVALANPRNAILSETAGLATVTLLNDDATIGKGFVSNGGFESDLSENDDVLPGTDLNDRINGLGGADSIDSGAGDDSLTGGPGDDTLIGNLGDDTLVGGEGNDSLYPSQGANIVLGGEGNDYIQSDYGNDTIDAGPGDDVIVRDSSATSSVDGGAGNDNIYGSGNGDDTLLGGGGNDVIGYRGFDLSLGSWSSENGNDLIDGGTGNDFLHGGYGNDTILGGDGDDSLHGGHDNDLLDGGKGNDLLAAYTGNDVLRGGLGQDTLSGHDGNDTLEGGADIDILYGDAGDDTFVFNKGDSGVGAGNRDIIGDFTGTSTAEVIDLHGLSDNALTFKAGAAFSGADQVRYVLDFANKITIVQVNLDADVSSPELEVELVGVIPLVASDFILAKPSV
jgi:Ca2+-binding RTX toxin-like protein